MRRRTTSTVTQSNASNVKREQRNDQCIHERNHLSVPQGGKGHECGPRAKRHARRQIAAQCRPNTSTHAVADLIAVARPEWRHAGLQTTERARCASSTAAKATQCRLSSRCTERCIERGVAAHGPRAHPQAGPRGRHGWAAAGPPARSLERRLIEERSCGACFVSRIRRRTTAPHSPAGRCACSNGEPRSLSFCSASTIPHCSWVRPRPRRGRSQASRRPRPLLRGDRKCPGRRWSALPALPALPPCAGRQRACGLPHRPASHRRPPARQIRTTAAQPCQELHSPRCAAGGDETARNLQGAAAAALRQRTREAAPTRSARLGAGQQPAASSQQPSRWRTASDGAQC